jgi:outer membrane murein-binding lipoprotein Lpp
MSFSSEEPEYDPRHQSEGMSATSKVLLIVAVILGLLMLACCGGVYYFTKQVKMEQSSTPADVLAAQQAILPANIPERFEPSQSIRMNLIVAEMDMAIFEAKAGEKSGIALLRMKFLMDAMEDQQASQQMRQQNPVSQNLKNMKSEDKTYEVDGKELVFTFAHGELQGGKDVDPADIGKEWYSVQSLVPVKQGMIMFTMTGPEEEFDQAEIDALIESIQLDSE